jgi:hypothetical protein
VTAEQEILEDRGMLEQLDVLERARDPAPRDLVRRHAGDILARKESSPRVGS